MVKKKDKKKIKKTVKKSSVKKAVKKLVTKKIKKQSVSKKPAKAAKPKVKKPAKAVKPKAKKAALAKPKAVATQIAKKKEPSGKIEKKKIIPQKFVKQKTKHPAKPALPLVKEQKPKGSPTQLSMALEEKETKPVFIKPRITRSKSGNLLFQLEYTIRSSPVILYEFLTTPSGMAQWFADIVDITGSHCIFVWEGFEEKATIIDSIPDEYIRYRWDNTDEDEYFEFRISKNEITSDTILTITDFSSEGEMKNQKMLWDSQVKLLTQQIGG